MEQFSIRWIWRVLMPFQGTGHADNAAMGANPAIRPQVSLDVIESGLFVLEVRGV